MNQNSTQIVPKHRNRLSVRIVVIVLLCSSILTLLTTAFQLYFDYRKAVRAIQSNIQFIQESYLPAITFSVYTLDEKQVEILLEGSLNILDIEYMEIEDTSKNLFKSAGNPALSRDVTKVFPLDFTTPSGKVISVGILKVFASLDGIYHRLLEKALVILLSNAVKTFLASILFLMIINHMVVRHLIKISNFTRYFKLNELSQELTLNRKVSESTKSDELEQLVQTINEMIKKLCQTYEILEKSNIELINSNKKLQKEITAHKQTEKALQESEEKYRSMMESMKDAAYISSSEYKIEYMNPAMIDRVGHDATGKICHKAIYDRDEKCSWCVYDQIEQKRHTDYEMINPKDNHHYYVAASPVVHIDGTISKLTIFHDITAIKNIEAQLQQAQKMESIGTLTGGIAHDFNNILGIIVGNTELALDDVPKHNPAYSSLEEVKAASLRAKNIVKQLLSFSRKTDQKLQPIQIASVIKDALKFLRSTIPTTINIHQDIQTTEETILADPTQINQIIMNLCINASHAMEQTGGDLTIAVAKVILDDNSAGDYPGLKSGDHVKIMISDTGPGIDPEIIGQIFDPYFTTKEIGKGSGMGLAVVHGIVKSHSGAIAVDSSLGKGAEFIILFPLATEKPIIETKTNMDIPGGNETILFVDDEISIVRIVKRMFERLGYKVETATTPQEALDRFSLNPDHFDLVITDMTMPQMTGVKLSEKLMDIRKDIPIIVCTGYSNLVDEEKAKGLGLAAYVMKPIDMHETAQTIRKVLDKKCWKS
jgi:PAS domain S-box-containing protein